MIEKSKKEFSTQISQILDFMKLKIFDELLGELTSARTNEELQKKYQIICNRMIIESNELNQKLVFNKTRTETFKVKMRDLMDERNLDSITCSKIESLMEGLK